FDVTVGKFLAAGASTQPIDLPGDLRVLRSVELVYRTRVHGSKGLATAILYGGDGMKSVRAGEGDPAPGVSKKRAANQGILLNESEVSLGKDHEIHLTSRSKSYFRGIELEILGNPIEILDVQVTFGNGYRHDVTIRKRVGADTRMTRIYFPGNARII